MLRSVSVYVLIVIKNMPWSPKSILAAHQPSHISPFSRQRVREFLPVLRAYLEQPTNRGLRRQVFVRLGSLFQMHHSRSMLRSVLATLARNNIYDRRFGQRVFWDLDEMRDVFNDENRSPPPSP